MGRKVKNLKDLTRGFKGWEKQYIKNSIKYGHLDDTKRVNNGTKSR